MSKNDKLSTSLTQTISFFKSVKLFDLIEYFNINLPTITSYCSDLFIVDQVDEIVKSEDNSIPKISEVIIDFTIFLISPE